jgi:hypothetical protein
MLKRVFVPPVKLSEYIVIDGGKRLYLTEHSKGRINARKISGEDIKNTFQTPDIVVPHIDYSNARNYMKRINENNDRLKIGVKDDAEPFIIITAFIQTENS